MNILKRLTKVTAVTSMVVMAIFLLSPAAIEAEECYVIKVFGEGSPPSVRIEPDLISISKGNCVVWINWARATEVTVKFQEGKRCAEATKAPMGFRMDAMNCFVTDHIPLGGTASLMFSAEGTFDYEVETPFATPKRGRVIVKE